MAEGCPLALGTETREYPTQPVRDVTARLTGRRGLQGNGCPLFRGEFSDASPLDVAAVHSIQQSAVARLPSTLLLACGRRLEHLAQVSRPAQPPCPPQVRRRILMVCKQCYWNQLEGGLIGRDAAKYLGTNRSGRARSATRADRGRM